MYRHNRKQQLGKQINALPRELGDFTANPRVLWLALCGIGIGVLSAYVALALLRLIGLFTNLFFFHRWDTALISPANNRLGLFEIFVPVVGSLIVGMMARYGSERIRGHGIPEAIESILIKGSRVEPKLAVLKPLSSAISIGSGGPFGAEGPIIMTGGAIGSMLAQFMHLTSAERRTLLVAGAAGGMSATFGTPVAATLLAVELLLFEWKPRSFVPVALASASAACVRHYIIATGPLFSVPSHSSFIGPSGLLGCLAVGVLAGGLSALLTLSVYAAEDAFHKLPIHWMWWPAIGGVVVGLGGLFFPQALGVGYGTIGALLSGPVPGHTLWGILIVKWLIWAIALGSGTSGGVLAPLLLIGGALGGAEAHFLPFEGLGFWPLISMGAVLGGTMRSPFTGVLFALELTHDFNALLPLLIAVTIAHAFTVLTMRRSILTEKISRRGYHLSREYATDPLEILFVRDVMPTNVLAFPSSMPLQELYAKISLAEHRGQRLFPVVDSDARMIGVVTRADVQRFYQEHGPYETNASLVEIARRDPVKAYPDESLTTIVTRMAETAITQLPVVDRHEPSKLVSVVSLADLLKARAHRTDEERRRERALRMSIIFPIGRGRKKLESVVDTSVPPKEASEKDGKRHWAGVRGLHGWSALSRRFKNDLAKMVCGNCHHEFPFDLKCPGCESSDFALGNLGGTAGAICQRCLHPQLHWDCPDCGRRQLFATAFRHDRDQLKVA